MNLFEQSKLKENTSTVCFICGKEFKADKRNTKRGWGLFCSKSCSAMWRKKKKDKGELRDYRLRQIGL